MDYPFENLNPEKFQLFCQSILAKEYPGVQCMPVAQPDGGRDAFRVLSMQSRDFVVFQVKYVRQPLVEKDSHKWLEEIVRQEAPKIRELIPKGAREFVLITNIPGTAHPDTGSIDKVNAILSTSTGLKSMCWWRNDLSRRLDNAWSLKWVYPELMTGPDLIRFVIEQGLSEDKERRAGAIRAFITTQFNLDEEVKFKQVDLQNRLLDLFIDVPVTHRHGRWVQEAFHVYGERYIEEIIDEDEADVDEVRYHHPFFMDKVGAATYLLGSSNGQSVVLEGAPGQGKSTITQYVCQVHRMRLLDKTHDLQQVVQEHKSSAVYLPIKIDLRDFATWLQRRNPFAADNIEINQGSWNKSLESFIAALITHHSGGVAFDVADLHSVLRISAVLLVLDGLDEVADIQKRTEVVNEIIKGVERLKSISASLKTVVTSRPAAFVNSPGLPPESYQYISLDSVTQELIDEYADKWLKARRLKERESGEVKTILREKLKQPHLRDLARNPMQLAILLSLIHTRGSSLPDKRTALYDSYMELFFNREAEKSPIVRDRRDLLIDIHRYLAWLLHTESESGGTTDSGRPSGAIEENRLKQVLTQYLIAEGHAEPELPEKLFAGVVERVVALVSRVQGTYEFEVQPLREYFAARYLYETAPYSPPGAERQGTKPDRFDAIARNFYWLNVTRFYAGCYSKGELASLIENLGELIVDKEFRFLSHPRVLAATLLSDWVFSQHPKSVEQVVELTLDDPGLKLISILNSRRTGHPVQLTLPVACGGGVLISKCVAVLQSQPPYDYAIDIANLLRVNLRQEDIRALWLSETRKAQAKTRSAWFCYGTLLGVLKETNPSDLSELLSDAPLDVDRADALLRGRRSDIISAAPELFDPTIDMLLKRQISTKRSFGEDLIGSFGLSINPAMYAAAFKARTTSVPLLELWKRRRPSYNLELQSVPQSFAGLTHSRCNEVIELAVRLGRLEAGKWATSLDPWETLTNALDEKFGKAQWATYYMAVIASGIRSSSEKCPEYSELCDLEKSICRRARYARLRTGNASWWERQFEAAKTTNDKMLCCTLWATWASPNTIIETQLQADSIITNLSVDAWTLLHEAAEEAYFLTRSSAKDRVFRVETSKISLHLSERMQALLMVRSKNTDVGKWLYNNGLAAYKGKDISILKASQLYALLALSENSGKWNAALSLLARGYSNSYGFSEVENLHWRMKEVSNLSQKVAEVIMRDSLKYPSVLVASAERTCRDATAKNIEALAVVAGRAGWFN
jgi:hypothetical protein